MAYRGIINKFSTLQIKDLDPEELRTRVTNFLSETKESISKKNPVFEQSFYFGRIRQQLTRPILACSTNLSNLNLVSNLGGEDFVLYSTIIKASWSEGQ